MNQNYSCVIVDDDLIYTELMERFVNEIDFLNLRGVYNNPIEAIVDMEKNGNPDILFLDVEMPQINAFVAMEALDPKPSIVIVSSHWQYEEKLLAEGVSKFISKPIRDAKHLADIAEEVLGI